MIFARRGVLYGLYAALAVPVLAVAGSAAFLYSDIYMTADKFEAILNEASTDQIPTDPSEFVRLNLPERALDAAPVIQKLDKEWQSLSAEKRTEIQNQFRAYAMPGETDTGTTQQIVRSALPILDLYRKAATKTDSNIERDWNACVTLFEPNYHTIIEVSRLNCSYAIGKARTGSANDAYATLHLIRRLGQHISRDSGMDGLALHSLLETMSLTAAEQILFLHGDRPDIVRAYDSFIQNRETAPNVVRNLEGEAMRTIVVLSEPDSHKNRIFAGAKLSLRGEVFQKAAAVRMTEFWISSIGAVRAVYPDTIASSDAYRESVSSFLQHKSPSRMVPGSIAEWHQHRVQSAAALEVRYKLASVFKSLAIQYHKTGKLPNGLGDVATSLTDPMTGDPFSFAVIEGGIQLFGRGSNGINDDGTNNADIVLRLSHGLITNEGV